MLTEKENQAVKMIHLIIENPEMRRYLKKQYQKSIQQGAHSHTGFCSMACDALRRILGGQVKGFGGYKLMRVIHEGGPHYYIKTPQGAILDPTRAQFKTIPPYSQGRGQGLPTPKMIIGDDKKQVQAPTIGAKAIMDRFIKHRSQA
jgi:hypothetical protein